MNTKRNGTIWFRVMTIAVAVMVVLGMLLSVTAARGDDGVTEAPLATATATAEPTDDSVAEAPEVEDEGEKPDAKPTKAPKPTATATVEPTEDPTEEPTQEPTSTATATVEPTEDPTEEPTQAPTPTASATAEPTEEPVPPMEQFVDVTIGKCEVTITQKMGVDWTEVIADNGTPNHWGITKGKPNLVVKPVDASKDLVVRIIPVISENEAWEYSVTLEAGSCNNPDPGPTPTPTPTDPPTSTPTPTPTDPPTTGEPTDPPTSTPTPTPTEPPSSKPTKAPTTAPSGDPGSDKDKSDPKGPAKTGVTGGNSTDAILVALAAMITLALVAMRMGRRSSGKYAARS